MVWPVLPNPGKWIGQRVKRREDPRLLRGEGKFVDDIHLYGMLHAAVLRSPYAHGWVRQIKTEAACRLAGVVSVITFRDIAHLARPIPMRLEPTASLRSYLQYPLAKDKVRYVGEPLAVVVATSRYVAEDALDLVEVEYEPLAAAASVPAALGPDAVLIHENTGSNLAARGGFDIGDTDGVFKSAPFTVAERFRIQRHTAMPLETRGLVAEYEPGTQFLNVWGPTKVPHFNRSILASFLGFPEHRIHFIEPDVGGGFGVRGEFYPEDFLIPFLAFSLQRPVKWVEDRREHFVAANHSREQTWEAEIAARSDGTLLGLRATIWNDMGAYVRTHGGTVPSLSAAMFPGPYRIPNYWCEWNAVITNKTPIGTYRAPGRYECNFVRERLMDLLSGRLNMDPAELRRRNLIRQQELPYNVKTSVLETPIIYDSGNYSALLEKALTLSDYPRLRRTQKSAAARGKCVGIGMACFLEKTGLGPFEVARIRMDRSGRVVVFTGLSALGQGTETILAQICAEQLEMQLEEITVMHGDSLLVPYGTGSYASRGAVMGGSAVWLAAQAFREKLIALAASHFGCSAEEIVLRDSSVSVRGREQPVLSFAELMQQTSNAWKSGVGSLQLEVSQYYEAREMSYPAGVQVALVEVDRETGVVEVKKLWSLFDVGRAVNPLLAEGQIVGGIAQGLGGAFLEELPYDSAGQLLATSFMDYLLPSSAEMPPIEVQLDEDTPSPLNPLGAKGAGEGGTAGVGAVIANAVSDALKDLGISITELPLSPHRLHQMIWQARHAREFERKL
ncbi:MAG: xanthine dehydrogenase family protein molybdopterin-binding subunit [Acidobacteria bacterium]|nr:xanthine dehydrogenase family protein molybdopterin-binding subunit [Acidobacteriota bacterium]